jgi:hypothetical protein
MVFVQVEHYVASANQKALCHSARRVELPSSPTTIMLIDMIHSLTNVTNPFYYWSIFLLV